MKHEFFGSIKRHEVSGGEGSIKRHEVFGSIKRHEVSGGETNNGSIKTHEVLGPSNEMRFKILYQICLSPSMHMKILMVITVQRAGRAPARPSRGPRTLWCYRLVRLG